MFSRLRLGLVAVALFASAQFGFATDFVVPKQSIVVSDGTDVVQPGKSVPLGESVDVTVSKPVEVVPFLQAVSYEWKVLEGGKERKFKICGESTNIWYAAGIKPKRNQVFCVVTYLYVVRQKFDDDKSPILEVGTRVQFLYAEVIIGEGEAPPVPVPVPPGPSIPDGKFKLGKTAYDLVLKNVAAGENRAKAAKALANSFKGVASAARAGTIKDVKTLLEKTTASNQTALKDAGVEKAEWEAFFSQFQDVLFGLYEKGTLTSLDDYLVAWGEVAEGLSVVK